MRRVICLAVLACAACGSSSGGGGPDGGSGNSVSGTVEGHSIAAQDAVFTFTSGYPNLPDGVAIVAIADRPNLCALLQSSSLPTGTLNVMGVALLNVGLGTINTLVTGPYTVIDLTHPPSVPGQYASGFFASGTCTTNTEYLTNTTSAAFNVTQVGTTSGTHMKGTFSSMTFVNASGSFSGTIDASYCAALNAPGNNCIGNGP